MVQKIIQKMLYYRIIDEDDKLIYEFGITNAIQLLINLGTCILIGVVTHNLAITILFNIIYSLLRVFSGGLHMKSRFSCWLISSLIVYISSRYYQLAPGFYVITFSSVVIFYLAPVETRSKRATIREKKAFKKISILITILYFLTSVAFYKKSPNISAIIRVTIVINAASMIFGKIDNFIDEKYRTLRTR